MKRYFTISMCFCMSFMLTISSCKTSQFTLAQSEIQKLEETYPKMNHKEDLNLFLNDVRTNVAEHDWASIFAKCSKMHYMQQVGGLKIKPAQYLAEILGLNYVENKLVEEGVISYKDLDNIIGIKYTNMSFDGNWMRIDGEVALVEGEKKALRMYVIVLDGKYVLTGPIG